MAWTWQNTATASQPIKLAVLTEINTNNDIINTNHCSSHRASVCSGHDNYDNDKKVNTDHTDMDACSAFNFA